MKSSAVSIFVLIFISVTAPAWANDSEYGNHSGSPAPVKNDAITMTSEDIVITARTDGYWDVSATYVFTNTTDKDVALTMGFPEIAGDPGKEFLKFKTLVRGEPVKLAVKKSAPFLKKGSEPLGRVHLFEVTFKPNEVVTIQHDYQMEGGGSVAVAIEKTVQYVTRTGAMWKGPIGRATFTINTREVYEIIAWSPEFNFKSLTRNVLQKGVTTGMSLVLENTNWTPQGDLAVDLMSDEGFLRGKAVGGDCPELKITDYSAYRKAKGKERLQYFEVSSMDEFDSDRLRLCRNWRYARYGYTFKDTTLNKRFYGKVYTGKYPPHAVNMEGFDGVERKMAPLMPDPGFTPAMLNEEDLFYLKALRTEERRRREAKDAN